MTTIIEVQSDCLPSAVQRAARRGGGGGCTDNNIIIAEGIGGRLPLTPKGVQNSGDDNDDDDVIERDIELKADKTTTGTRVVVVHAGYR